MRVEKTRQQLYVDQSLIMFNWLFGQQLLHVLPWSEKGKRRLDDTVEEEGKVDQHGETNDLELLEGLPAQTERDDPDKQGPASIDGRAGGSAYTTGNGQAKKVEAPEAYVSNIN